MKFGSKNAFGKLFDLSFRYLHMRSIENFNVTSPKFESK